MMNTSAGFPHSVRERSTTRAAMVARFFFILTISFTWATSASAVQLGFDCISNNFAADCATGEAQLAVDVTDPGGNQVLFTFSNTGPNPSAITDVYFDDGSLLGISTVINDPGFVEFSVPATPGNLPAANNANPPFVTTAGFSADADPPPAFKGVDPGEELGILFALQTGRTFADVLTELGNGDLRIGVHVQDFALGGSESFVNPPLPEPGVALLLAEGLAFLAIARRGIRRR